MSAQPLTSTATNNYQQVYLRNLQTGATTLVSVGLNGQAGNANSSGGQFAGAAISADDRYVAFTSAASNLVPGGTSGLNNVFVRDLAAGTTSLVSVHLAGVTGNNGAYGSGGPVISADGRYVAFSSDASDLVPNDPHQPNMDVFLRDLSTGTTTQVTTTGTYGTGMYGYTGSFANAITPDGQYVLFTSNASGLVPGYGGGAHDVYLWEQGTSTPKLVSLGIDGRSSRTGRPDANGSLGTAISADGRYAAFDSDAVNMVAGNTNNNSNVYVRDLQAGTTTLVSAEPSGSPPPDDGGNQSSMSADGRYVAFESTSQLLGPAVPSTPAYHVYLRDLQTGTISLADVSASGQVGNGNGPLPAYPSLSADGQSVAFTSNATNLLPGSAVGDWLLSSFSSSSAPPPAPAVTGVSPASGPAAGGTAVTVSGSNLTGGTVAFGGTAATGVSCSASSCTATSPAGTGTVDVRVTTAGGASATSGADQFTYTAAPPPPNLIPNPGFETPGVPSDHVGSTLARSQMVVHSGSWALAQTTRSSSGGWDLDSDPNWYVPVSSAHSYTAGIWVRSTATVRVDLGLDLLDSSGNYIDTASGPTVTLAAGTWTHLTITGIKPAAGEVYVGMGPNFSRAASGTVIYWDDMSLTSP